MPTSLSPVAFALSGLERTVQQFSASHDVQNCCNVAVEFVTGRLNADLAEVWTLNGHGGLTPVSSKGVVANPYASKRGPSFDGNPQRVFLTGDPIVVNEAEEAIEFTLKNYSRGLFVESFAYLPIAEESKRLGVFGIASNDRNFFSPEVVGIARVLTACLACVMQSTAAHQG